jgi:hypothetical protein
MTEGQEWNDPDLPSQRERHTRYRLAGGLVGLAIGVLFFSPTLTSIGPLLWPPGGTRWFTLVLTVGFSLMLPLMIGAALGESYARYRS